MKSQFILKYGGDVLYFNDVGQVYFVFLVIIFCCCVSQLKFYNRSFDELFNMKYLQQIFILIVIIREGGLDLDSESFDLCG